MCYEFVTKLVGVGVGLTEQVFCVLVYENTDRLRARFQRGWLTHRHP